MNPQSGGRWFRNRVTLAWMAVLVAIATGCFFYSARARAGRSTVTRVESAVADGKSIHWRQVTRVWLPRAAFFNGWVLLSAAALVPWARRPARTLETRDGRGSSGTGHASPSEHEARKWGWAGLIMLAGAAAWLTLPRLGQSVWGDEARTLREFIVGQFHTDANGARIFDAATWGDAFFHFRTPNNHVLYSVAAHATHQWLSRPPVGPNDAYFSEVALRLPAWVASMLAIFALAGMANALGWRRAGWIAVVLLILHPGFVRYAAEARGYAFLLLGGPLLVLCLVRAVRTGRWAWWWAAAALDFALIYTWPLAAHIVVVANLGALAAIWRRNGLPQSDRSALTGRLVVSGLLAVVVWLQLFLPNLIQLRIWLAGSSAQAAPGHGVLIDALSSMLTGRVWFEADASNPLLTSWSRAWQSHQAWVAAAWTLIVGSWLFGMIHLWRRSPEIRPWIPAMVLPPFLILAQSAATGSVLYPWYLVAGVPFTLFLVAVGLEELAGAVTRHRALQASVLGLAVCGVAAAGARTRDHLRHHPIEPNREAALIVQPVINPYHPDYQRDVLTAGFLMRNTIYDPGVREFSTVEELRALMAEASATQRDLAITYGQPALARQTFPEIMALLDDPRAFELVDILPGQEAYCTRHIVRHPPAHPEGAPAR